LQKPFKPDWYPIGNCIADACGICYRKGRPSHSNSFAPRSLARLAAFLILLWGFTAQADETRYKVEINAPAPLAALLNKHLKIIKWRDNPRMTPAEWQRLTHEAEQDIADLLATEGYFSPIIKPSLNQSNGDSIAHFDINPGPPTLISRVELVFIGAITQQASNDEPNIVKLRQDWLLSAGMQFRQEEWNQAKRRLLASLLVDRYPGASILSSKAEVDPKTQTAALQVEIDSGPPFHFGTLSIQGLQRYPPSIIENLNSIKSGSLYSQSELLTFQSRLLASGYFRNVEVTSDTEAVNADAAPIRVTVEENPSIKLGIGAGYSTNTGARTQLTLNNLNLLNRNWWLTSSLKVEQKAQSLSGLIRLPVTSAGYRDSINANLNRTSIEGQTTTSTQAGIKRGWGPRQREQSIGTAYLIEQQSLDGAQSSIKHAATLSYGITLRHVDNELAPTRGYLFTAQFAGAPLEALSDGRFLQSYVKLQGYYPITNSTQLIMRAEGGMVNGRNGAPAAFLFRAGGDQSVRGYAYQSLGVKEGDSIVGGRYLATGSIEVVQWLTRQWGTAVFVDFGNAANRLEDLKPVYGYGIGARWKSPIGPLGADIAYGENTGEYRIHFNLGVAF
jgi:translocation and assembly module TamA